MTEYSLQVYGTPAFLSYELYKRTQFRILSLSSIIHSTLKQLTIRTKTSDHIKCSDTPLQKHIIDIDNNRKKVSVIGVHEKIVAKVDLNLVTTGRATQS
jgi:hypothetical protein